MTYKVDHIKTAKRQLECYIPVEATASDSYPIVARYQAKTKSQPKEKQMPSPKPAKRKKQISPDDSPETIGELFDIMELAAQDEDGGGELEGRFSCWLEALPKLRKEYKSLNALAKAATSNWKEVDE